MDEGLRGRIIGVSFAFFAAGAACLYAYPEFRHFCEKMFLHLIELAIGCLGIFYICWGLLYIICKSIQAVLKRYSVFCDKMDATYAHCKELHECLGETNQRLTYQEGQVSPLHDLIQTLETRIKKLEPVPHEVKQERDSLTREFTGE